jgi:hypothetical protein
MDFKGKTISEVADDLGRHGGLNAELAASYGADNRGSPEKTRLELHPLGWISMAAFCLKKKKNNIVYTIQISQNKLK